MFSVERTWVVRAMLGIVIGAMGALAAGIAHAQFAQPSQSVPNAGAIGSTAAAPANSPAMSVAPEQVTAKVENIQLPRLIPTRDTEFSIPFQTHPSSDPEMNPAQIQLYVSSDQGVSWQHHASARPEERQFLFRAPFDGEYWFSLRTMNSRGQAISGNSLQPGLRVLVDTKSPEIAIKVSRDKQGRAVLDWAYREGFSKADSLTIMYR